MCRSSPFTFRRNTNRQKRRRYGNIRIIAPDLSLGLIGKHTGHPSMTGQDTPDPGTGRAGPPQFAGERRLRAVIQFHAAIPGGLQCTVKPGLAEIAVGLFRYPPVELRLTRTLDKHRSQVTGTVDKLCLKRGFIHHRLRRRW